MRPPRAMRAQPGEATARPGFPRVREAPYAGTAGDGVQPPLGQAARDEPLGALVKCSGREAGEQEELRHVPTLLRLRASRWPSGRVLGLRSTRMPPDDVATTRAGVVLDATARRAARGTSQEWRGPESSRRHHDFQGAVSAASRRAKALQTEHFDGGAERVD